MPRIAWLTDIHLNFVQGPDCVEFLNNVAASGCDAVVISGDIGESDTLASYLGMIVQHIACPVYFVLGNHDFYLGSFLETHQTVRDACREHPNLHWLSDGLLVPLTDETALVGHDGWADGRNGDYVNSDVLLNDFFLIKELRGRNKSELYEILTLLGDDAANYFAEIVPRALATHDHLLLVTHVPPFREASMYEGHVADDNYLPHFSNRVIGETLTAIMQEHPDKRLTILCGHTHHPAQIQVAPNIVVRAGAAEYGHPRIQDIIEI